ncbi:TonB-dependent siderophore receptor [Pusillimonas sp. TS35]|nr:TonB-dependent siderophore receptor [Pusillimonas sp. TS35]
MQPYSVPGDAPGAARAMPRRIAALILPLAATGFLPLAAHADSSAPGQDVQTLAPIPVSSRIGSQIMPPVQSTLTLDREQLDVLSRGSDSLATVLAKAVPGMSDASRTATDYGQTLRGRNMLVLVDGIPLNTNRNASRTLASINMADIEEIEILRGSSALYGAEASGGIISIRTRRPTGGFISETTVSGTSSLTNPGAAGLGGELQHYFSGANGALDYSLNVGAGLTGASFDAHGRRIAPDPSQGDWADSRSYSVAGKLGFNMDADQRLQLSVNYQDIQQDTDYVSDPAVARLPPGSVSARPLRGLELDRQNALRNQMVALDYEHRALGDSTLAAQIYYRDMFTRFGPFDARAISVRGNHVDQAQQNSSVLGGRLTIKTPLGGSGTTMLTWGGDVSRERSDMPLDIFDGGAYDVSGGLVYRKTGKLTYMPPVTTTIGGLFAQLEHRFSPSWAVQGGIRYDRAAVSFDDFQPLSQLRASSPQSVRGGNVSYHGWSYNAGLVYTPVRGHDVHLSYSEGFELPDVGLQIRNARPGFDIGSSSLEPIKTRTVELGWRGQFSEVSAFVTAFQSWSDLGAVQTTDFGLTLQRNRERIRGIEAGLDYLTADERWGWGGSVAWMQGRERPQGSADYRDMTGYRIPPLKLSAYVDYRPSERWQHRLQLVSFASKDYRLDGRGAFGRRDTHGYTLLDLVSSYKLDRNSRISVGVENLLNRDYHPLYSQLMRSNNNASRLPGSGTTVRVAYTHRW